MDNKDMKENESKVVTGEELDKALQKIDRKVKVKKSLENEKVVLEETFKTHPEFMRYMEVLEQIKKAQEDIDELKPMLAINMETYEQSKYTGKNVVITLKKSTQVRSISVDDFVQEFSVGSEMYNKLVKFTNRKGSVTIKEL